MKLTKKLLLEIIREMLRPNKKAFEEVDKASAEFFENGNFPEGKVQLYGEGVDKIVMSHEDFPQWIFKRIKKDPASHRAGEEVAIWKKFKDTPLKEILAEIISDAEFYSWAMRKGKGSGSEQEVRDYLWGVAEKMDIPRWERQSLYRDFEWLFLSDIRKPGNLLKIGGKSKLVDYDQTFSSGLRYLNKYLNALKNISRF